MSPVIDPDLWFVDPASASLGNQVTPYVDGIEMMTDMVTYVSQLADGDFCFFGAWKMSGYFQFPGASQSLLDDFLTALENGADVRLLLWRGTPGSPIMTGSGPVTHRGLHLRLKSALGGAGGQVIIDDKLPTVGSHHHKYAIFGKQTSPGIYELTAFCGGIDLVDDRKDDDAHLLEVLKGYTGWHDVHAKIEGPAAEAIWQDFIRRWNEHPDEESYFKTATTEIVPGDYTIQVPSLANPVHRVEPLYTYHCSHFRKPHATVDTVYYDFVPVEGIHTIQSAYLNAIARAQYYIYMENQYFFDDGISQALRDKLNDNPDIHIFCLMPEMGTFDRYYRNRNLDIVREAAGAADRFHPCEPHHDAADAKTGAIYVHAKMIIVDDLYVTLGSGNFSPRSMTHDSEINIGVLGTDLVDYLVDVDGTQTAYTVSRSVRDLRVRLWREHLQIAPPEDNTDEPDLEDDPLLAIPNAISTFIGAIDVPPSRLRAVTTGFGNLPNPLWNLIWHPSQDCGNAITTDGGDTGLRSTQEELETDDVVR